MCAEPREPDQPGGRSSVNGSGGGSGVVYVEATLLLLRKPGKRAGGGGGSGGRQLSGALTPLLQPGQQAVAGPAPQRQLQPPQGHRLPASSWNMLSALAGGSTKRGGVLGSSLDEPEQQAEQQGRTPAPSPAQGAAARRQAPPPATPPRPPEQQGPAPPVPARSPFQGSAPTAAGRPAGTEARPPAARVPVQRPGQQQPQQQERAVQPAPEQQHHQQRVTVGDYLVDSLTAQSLDLPPAAARWRQQQRRQAVLLSCGTAVPPGPKASPGQHALLRIAPCVGVPACCAGGGVQAAGSHAPPGSASSCIHPATRLTFGTCCAVLPCPACCCSDACNQRKLIVWEVDEVEPWEGEGRSGAVVCVWGVGKTGSLVRGGRVCRASVEGPLRAFSRLVRPPGSDVCAHARPPACGPMQRRRSSRRVWQRCCQGGGGSAGSTCGSEWQAS